MELIKISDFPQVNEPSEWIAVADANGIGYKISKADFKDWLGTVQTIVPKAISPTDPAPTLPGIYRPTTSGTYTNLGGLVIDNDGKLNEVLYDGSTFVNVVTPLPASENKIEDWVAGIRVEGEQRDWAGQRWEVVVPSTSQEPGTGTDWVAKTPKKYNPFLTSDSDLTDYKLGTIIEIGKFEYVDNGDALYISNIRANDPLVQIINDSSTVIAQYFPNVGGVATGIQEIDIKSPTAPYNILFKAIVDWDEIGSITQFNKKLKLVKLLNYTNNLKQYIDNGFYQKAITDNNDKQVNLLSVFETTPANVPVQYMKGTILDYWVTEEYVDNGDVLFLKHMSNPRPLLQVVNQSDVTIAQYFINDLNVTETGIKIMNLNSIISPSITLFKVKINWDKLNSSIGFEKTLRIDVNKLLVNKEYIDNKIEDLETEVDNRLNNVLTKEETLERYINLFDKNDPDIRLGVWVPANSTTGIPSALTNGSFMTGFIPVSEGDKITPTRVGAKSTGYYSIWDENKQIITQDSIIIPQIGDEYAYIVKPGESFIRIAFRDQNVTVAQMGELMITKNKLVLDEYIPFGYKKAVDAQKLKFPNTRNGQTIAWFGDSFIEFGNMPQIMREMTGGTVINGGIGGTRMAKHQVTPNDYDAFSMYSLADAIATGDWTRQVAAAIYLRDVVGDDNVDTVERMKNTDYSKVNILISSFGTNDLSGGNAIGVNTDNDGETIKGAVNYSIQKILTAFPNIKMLFTTPLYRRFGGIEGVSSDEYVNANGDSLPDVINAIEEVCRINHVDCLTLYNKASVNAYNFTNFSADGTHPNQLGYQKYGDMFARYINSN